MKVPVSDCAVVVGSSIAASSQELWGVEVRKESVEEFWEVIRKVGLDLKLAPPEEETGKAEKRPVSITEERTELIPWEGIKRCSVETKRLHLLYRKQ